jgi:hypothetical protein
MCYPVAVLHFNFKVNETERQIAEIYIRHMQDLLAVKQLDDEFLAWVEDESSQIYARAVNLRNAMRLRNMPRIQKEGDYSNAL